MDTVNITKGGLRQSVSRQAFEQQYRPNGWVIDESEPPTPDETQETVKRLAYESEIKNYLAMKKRVPKKFDDGLFISETQG